MSTGIETDPDGGTLVDIQADVSGALLARIEALGGTVFSQHPRYRAIQARLPLASLETLAADASVQSIRPAIRPINNKIDTSEGDVAHAADDARATFGVDGTGIKVCALSDSVDYLSLLQGTGDLPAVTVLPGQSGNPGTSEGTAMLEIIHDLAPGAELYFATAFSNKATFAANILALRDAGCDILVDDVFYPEEAALQDDIVAQAVNTVIADGAFYFSAAGNSGNIDDGTSGVWEGDFVSTSAPPSLAGRDVHDFGAGNNSNTVIVDTPFLFTLQWSDPFGGSDNDYDLYLLDPTLSTVWAASTNIQNGNDDPFESIDSRFFDDTGTRLVIVRNPGAEARYLHLNNTSRCALSGDRWSDYRARGGEGSVRGCSGGRLHGFRWRVHRWSVESRGVFQLRWTQTDLLRGGRNANNAGRLSLDGWRAASQARRRRSRRCVDGNAGVQSLLRYLGGRAACRGPHRAFAPGRPHTYSGYASRAARVERARYRGAGLRPRLRNRHLRCSGCFAAPARRRDLGSFREYRGHPRPGHRQGQRDLYGDGDQSGARLGSRRGRDPDATVWDNLPICSTGPG